MNDLPWPALVFDTETSGLPDFKLPADDPAQPRIVQLAAQLVDAEGAAPIAALNRIIRPDGWSIPDEVAKIHGITTEIATEQGVPIAEALDEFMALFDKAAIIAAYGVAFDAKMLRGALRRAGLPDRYGDKPDFCVMRACVDLCKIPPTDAMMATGRKYFKTPNLTEAASILLKFDHAGGAHRAHNDVATTVALYRLLAAKGLVKPKTRVATRDSSAPAPAAKAPVARQPVPTIEEDVIF